MIKGIIQISYQLSRPLFECIPLGLRLFKLRRYSFVFFEHTLRREERGEMRSEGRGGVRSEEREERREKREVRREEWGVRREERSVRSEEWGERKEKRGESPLSAVFKRDISSLAPSISHMLSPSTQQKYIDWWVEGRGYDRGKQSLKVRVRVRVS